MENKVAALLLLCLSEVTKEDERSDTEETSQFSSRLSIVSDVLYATSFRPSTLCYVEVLQPGIRHHRMLKQPEGGGGLMNS